MAWWVITLWLFNTTFCRQRFSTSFVDTLWIFYYPIKSTKSRPCHSVRSVKTQLEIRTNDRRKKQCQWINQSICMVLPSIPELSNKSTDRTQSGNQNQWFHILPNLKNWIKELTLTSLQKVKHFHWKLSEKETKVNYDYIEWRANKKTWIYEQERQSPKTFRLAEKVETKTNSGNLQLIFRTNLNKTFWAPHWPNRGSRAEVAARDLKRFLRQEYRMPSYFFFVFKKKITIEKSSTEKEQKQEL